MILLACIFIWQECYCPNILIVNLKEKDIEHLSRHRNKTEGINHRLSDQFQLSVLLH